MFGLNFRKYKVDQPILIQILLIMEQSVAYKQLMQFIITHHFSSSHWLLSECDSFCSCCLGFSKQFSLADTDSPELKTDDSISLLLFST
jgi:hypothetical protein